MSLSLAQARKTVPLEALAVDFRMRTADVIDRIHTLEAQGTLTGIMDERGKVCGDQLVCHRHWCGGPWAAGPT
jgi:hypothetical protein